MKTLIIIFLLTQLLHCQVLNFDTLNSDIVLANTSTFSGFTFSGKGFATNYGYNFDVNSTSLYYLFNNDSVTISSPEVFRFAGLNLCQVSQKSTVSLIFKGYSNDSLLFVKSYTPTGNWDTLSLNFIGVNKIVIVDTDTLADYNFDNINLISPIPNKPYKIIIKKVK